MIAIHLKTKNDTNGNPRRIYMIVGALGSVRFVDEGNMGFAAIKQALGKEAEKVVGTRSLEITPGEYRRLKKECIYE